MTSVSAAPVSATPVRRRVTLWELLVWTYQDQLAHRLGFGGSHWSRAAWVDLLASLDDMEAPRPIVHPDAAAVHRLVCGLPRDVAEVVVRAARTGEMPERGEAEPRLIPVPNMERGGREHAVKGQWVDVPYLNLTAAEKAKLQAEGGRGEIERRATSDKSHVWRFRVDLRPKRRVRSARVTVNTDGSVRARNIGHAEADQVWSAWCPLQQVPSQGFIDLANAIHTRFKLGLACLERDARTIPFRSISVIRPEKS